MAEVKDGGIAVEVGEDDVTRMIVEVVVLALERNTLGLRDRVREIAVVRPIAERLRRGVTE